MITLPVDLARECFSSGIRPIQTPVRRFETTLTAPKTAVTAIKTPVTANETPDRAIDTTGWHKNTPKTAFGTTVTSTKTAHRLVETALTRVETALTCVKTPVTPIKTTGTPTRLACKPLGTAPRLICTTRASGCATFPPPGATAMRAQLTARFHFSSRSATLRPPGMCIRLLVLLWLLAVPRARAELVLGKPEWGFDGTTLGYSFNLLTVEVRNAGSQPFEGTLILDDGGQFQRRTSAPYLQQVFIAPGASRTVQFYPYFSGGFGDCRITWKEHGGGEVPIKAPDSGAPAVVLLADFDAPNLRSLRMRAFNEANFPPTAAATDALSAVVLDHQPRWDPVRREAFLDWLKRGGLVHLISGPDGTVPQFTNELQALNIPGSQGSVGNGLVVKHEIARTDVTPEFLRRAGYPIPEKRANANRHEASDRGIFFNLSHVTKPNIAWSIIYTLTLVYVAIVGPLFYFLRKRDYRLLLGGFVGCVALFAWLFTVIGRRGYGEKQIYHSVALARSIEPGKWDVRHWVHAFATSGGSYRFSHPGPSQLYAATSDHESVRGEVMQGREASFTADIPLFSSRPFVHQGVMSCPPLEWELLAFDGRHDASNTTGKFRLKQDFKGELLSVVAQYGSQFYRVERGGSDWELRKQKTNSSQEAFTVNQSIHHSRSYNETPEAMVHYLRSSPFDLARLIIGDDNSSRPALSASLPPERLRLFTYVNAPEAFPLQSTEFQAGLSLILFVQDLDARSQANP